MYNLFSNAKLPLKLLLYKECLELLQEIIVNRKQVFVLTAGLPEVQLNKMKQTEWHGLDKFLKIYFSTIILMCSAGEIAKANCILFCHFCDNKPS